MKRQRGFSLIELVVVMVLIAALVGLGAAAVGTGLPGQQLRGAARELAGELRFTRAQAIATGTEQVFELDVTDRRWTSAGKRAGRLPAELDLVATTARQEQPVRDVAAIRFFPDGAATGGRIVVKRGDAAWRIDVAWLTGEVTLRRGEGPP
jgi:general secretion pathway protein H